MFSRLRKMAEPSTDPASVQEREYRFPYHYIPAVEGGQIAYSVAMDWAADYLNGIELVRSTLERLGAKRVCDVGCGDGRLLNELSTSTSGVHFQGIDVSTRALALANLFRTRDNVQFRELDLRDSIAPDLLNQDLVTLIEVLEHVPPEHAVTFLQRAYQLVRPGGTFLVTVPHSNVPVHAKHYRHFTGSSLLAVLREALGTEAQIEIQFMDRVEAGMRLLASKLARNRFFSIEPLFQWRLRRRLGVNFVPEAVGARAVATITKPLG
jgi:SAM-dependent methyltransferase